MGQWEIYTTGGGLLLTDAFNFVAAFTSGPGYDALITAGITIGIIGLAWRLLWGEGIRDLFKWFVLIPILGVFFLGVRSSVVIFDRTQADHPVAIVDNIPWGIAAIGNITSSLGHDVTAIMEPLLSTPQDLGYQKSGMFFGAGLMAQSTRWRTTSSVFRSTLDHYMKRCVLDAANIGLTDIDELTTSTELVQMLGDSAPNALAFYNEFTGQSVTCSQGVSELLSEMDEYLDQVLIAEANSLFADNQYQSSLQKVNRLTGSMDGMLDLVTTSAATSRNMLAQSILIQALDDAAQGYIADTGNAAAMQHYQTARADRQTVSSYGAQAAQARKWVPMLKVTMEFVYYCFFPIAVFLMFTPMAFTVLKSYATGFVWLASWEPINAILHAIVIRRSAAYYREAGFATDSDGTAQFAMTFANHIGIRAVETDIAFLAGSLIAMVPFLAFALMYGAQKLASASTAMTNVAQSSAIETGREMATGNHSLSNVSMNNYNANKMNTSSAIDTGRHTEVMASGASRTVNANGTTTYATGTAGSNFLMGASVTSSLRQSAQASYQEAQTSVQSARAEESQSYERAHNTYSEMFDRSSYSGSLTDSGGRSYTEDQRNTVSAAKERVERLAEEHGLSSGLALSAGLGASWKVVNASGNLNAATQERYQRALNSAESSGLRDELSKVEAFRRDSGWQTSDEAQFGESWGDRNLINEANSARHTRALAEDSLRRAEQTQSSMASSDATVNASYGNMLQHYATNVKGMSEHEMLRVLNPQTPEAHAEAAQLTDSFVSDLVSGNLGNLTSTNTPHTEGLGVVALGVGGTRSSYNTSRENISSDPVTNNTTVGSTFGAVGERNTAIERERAQAERERTGRTVTTEGVVTNQIANNRSSLEDNSVVEQFIKESIDTWAATGGAAYDYFTSDASHIPTPLTATERDHVIRTIIGEAAAEGSEGWAAVAHVVQNRMLDSRWASDATGVVKDPREFSAWNSDSSGNSLPHTARPDSEIYQNVGRVVDQVFSGQTSDPTYGAVNYYSPSGMQALVNSGYQTNLIPTWWDEVNSNREAPVVQIGGHIFGGQSNHVPSNQTGMESLEARGLGTKGLPAPHRRMGG